MALAYKSIFQFSIYAFISPHTNSKILLRKPQYIHEELIFNQKFLIRMKNSHTSYLYVACRKTSEELWSLWQYVGIRISYRMLQLSNLSFCYCFKLFFFFFVETACAIYINLGRQRGCRPLSWNSLWLSEPRPFVWSVESSLQAAACQLCQQAPVVTQVCEPERGPFLPSSLISSCSQ